MAVMEVICLAARILRTILMKPGDAQRPAIEDVVAKGVVKFGHPGGLGGGIFGKWSWGNNTVCDVPELMLRGSFFFFGLLPCCSVCCVHTSVCPCVCTTHYRPQ